MGKLIRVAKEFKFEGIIAKRKDSYYESGKRTGAWVKYKINRGQEFVIGGYTPGNPFDALIVGYYEGEKLLYPAKVRYVSSALELERVSTLVSGSRSKNGFGSFCLSFNAGANRSPLF